MLTTLIDYLYWKYFGNVTIFGRFNGKAVIICYKGGQVGRLAIEEGGGIENVKLRPGYVPPEEMEALMEIYGIYL